jgi:AAA+ superfamily predicted ATPase
MARAAELRAVSFRDLHERIGRAVEHVASADADPRDPFHGLYVTDEQARTLATSGPPPQLDERLDELARRLGLDPLERSILAVCSAPEVSARYARLYGYLHDDLTRQLASARLAAALLAGGALAGEAVLARLAAGARLRRVGALELLDEPRLPLADRPLKCADAIAALLLGGAGPDDHDGPPAELIAGAAVAAAAAEDLHGLRALLDGEETLPLAVVGSDAPSALAAGLDGPVLLARLCPAVGCAALHEDPRWLPRLRLRAALAGAALAFTGLSELAPGDRAAAWRTLLESGERPLLCVEPAQLDAVLACGPMLVARLPAPGVEQRRAAWARHAPHALTDDVAVKFRLSATQIERAAQIARATARSRGASAPSGADLDLGARSTSRHGLEGLARRVEGAFDFEDLILPERARRALETIAAYLRHRDRVLADWGYGAAVGWGRGITSLFAGESGTGKTMAAQVVAHAFGLELFRVDLATVVSKFIGETEKQLDRIFTAAEGSNAVLLFDEADALFGKRSEVHDAHDRYANVEVAYLLQRIERYEGAVILTTNLRQNIDEAFLRRLDLVVEFPFPEVADRARLWRRLLPAQAPVEDIDVDFLASRFKLSGGSIRNVSLSGALLAAADGGRITMEHLARAVALEYDKLGRLTLASDFERFYGAVRPPVAPRPA